MPPSNREDGNAVVEFVGVLAVLVVPAVIALLAASALLMGQTALGAAARDGARAFVRADTVAQGYEHSERLAQQALDSRGVQAQALVDVQCLATPCLSPGAAVTFTVQADIEMPFLHSVKLTREATVAVDELRVMRQ